LSSSAAPCLALTLPGGGARGAYQAGVLERLGEAAPELEFPVLCGVSAGAINAAFLANASTPLHASARALSALWSGLRMDQVVRDKPTAMLANVARWGTQLLSGGVQALPQARGLLDTAPLRSFLHQALEGPTGVLPDRMRPQRRRCSSR
jgi:NTE family protein